MRFLISLESQKNHSLVTNQKDGMKFLQRCYSVDEFMFFNRRYYPKEVSSTHNFEDVVVEVTMLEKW